MLTDDARGSVPKLLLRVPEACQATGLSRTTLYELIGKGEIEAVRVGTAVRIPVDGLERWIEGKRAECFMSGGA